MNNFFPFQASTIPNGDDHNHDRGHGISYTGGATGGIGLTPWSTALKPHTTETGLLIRQSSSPPTFFHQQLTTDFGIISNARNGENCNQLQSSISNHKHKQSRLSSNRQSTSHGFTIGPWEESKSIVFDPSQVNGLSGIGSTDKLSAENSTAWKIRAKRGFATDPRSIAERERRTLINYKLKKLQDLLPNIDKQMSYAEMLDVAVEHVKLLQNQVQGLNNELDRCTCGCKPKK